MTPEQKSYQSVRDYMLAGDIIAFGGTGIFSTVIKTITASPVSHVGIILETKAAPAGDPQPGRIVDVLESTTLNGKQGVQRNRMSERVDGYKGRIWWLQLSDYIRKQMDMQAYYDYCLNQVGKPYDWVQAVLAGLHVPQPSIGSRQFCSEVAVNCMKAAGVRELQHVLASDVTPIELACMRLYASCVQIKGDPKDIRGFNSRDPWTADI